MPNRRPNIDFTPEALEDARQRYEDTDETQLSSSIAITRYDLARIITQRPCVLS